MVTALAAALGIARPAAAEENTAAAIALSAAPSATDASVADAALPEAGRGAERDTFPHIVRLPEVVVSTTRVGDRAPLARSVLGRDELVQRNWGQDTPMALAMLPGAYAYSDAGNGIGYSYLSIRGFPQRRISVLINGVPLNDPESHEVYWIDHPDLLASTAEVQMQRGVGSALYGAASVGGSVALETSPFSDTPRTAASIAYGSYETKRVMLELNSGRVADGWNFYGRYSRIETSGYRDDSWSKLWSYALSARKLLGNQSVQANLYGGPEETHLAYYGVPAEFLRGEISGDRRRDRRVNFLSYPNERDHFFEPHYELIHAWSPARGLTLAQTLFYFDGMGFYDELRSGEKLEDYRLPPWFTADTTFHDPDYFGRDANGDLIRDPQGRLLLERFDVVRRRTVANHHYGWVPRMRVEHAGGAITFGGEIRAHDGHHWGEVLTGTGLPPGTPPNRRYYDYHPRTLSGGLFAREEWQPAPRVLVTGDFGWRHQSYHMRGDRFDGIRFNQRYDFAIPRLGVSWTPRPDLTVFGSWSNASREPAFRDLYDAEGAGSAPLYGRLDITRGVYEDPLVRPEQVNDFELGGAWHGNGLRAGANLFHMRFRDELVDAGQFNTDLGYAILGNAARSVHQGAELSLRAERGLRDLALVLDANGSFSDNHFVRYAQFSERVTTGVSGQDSTAVDTLRFDDSRIGQFPSVIGNLSLRGQWKWFSLGGEAQYIGRVYLDNSEDRVASLTPRTVVNLIGGLRTRRTGGPQIELSVRVNNVFDRLYEAGGYTYRDEYGTRYADFIPAATRNVLAQLRVEF
jgi:iron complex outermembrane receptor protein